MKKILTLVILMLAGQAFAQTQLKIEKTNGETEEIAIPGNIYFNYEDRTLSWGGDENYSFDDYKSLRLTRDGLPWNLRWKTPNYDFHSIFGYGSAMHIRDLMTEDLFRDDVGYNHFNSWERNTSLSSRYATSNNIFNVMRSLTLGANEWVRALSESGQDQRGWLGVALACRAMTYLDMAQMYEFLPNDRTSSISALGVDVTGLTMPIIDETSQSDNLTMLYMIPRATKAQAVAFIEKDLQRAEELIVELDEPSHKVPHLDVVYGLMARLYMWTEDYQKARLYARKAIEATDSHVMTAEEMTSPQKGFNDLSCWMWGVQYDKLDDGVQSTIVNWTSWMSCEFPDGYGFWCPVKINKSLYERIADTDVRKQLFMAPQGSPLYGQQTLLNPDSYLSPYASLKFRPNEGNLTDKVVATSSAYPLMRVEEMYLIEAEAAAHQSPAEGAALLQSFISQYRNPGYVCRLTEDSAVIDEIILQKRIELWGEGQIFFDWKRLNMSVTRDYEGTNFPERYRINTKGRPAWMNFVFPRPEEDKNLSMVDMNNSDPSDCYTEGWTGPITDEEAMKRVSGSIVLQEPRFKADIPYVPVTAVDLFLLHYDNSEVKTDGLSISYTPQISLSPDFPQNGVAPVSFPLWSSSLFSTVRFLQSVTGADTSAGNTTVYLRVRGRVGEALSYSLYSNTISFGIKMPAEWPTSSKDNETIDYLPTATITPLELFDMQRLAEQDKVKACDITLNGEGELRHYNADYSSFSYYPISYEMKYPEDVRYIGSMSVDKDGYADNERGYFTNQAADAFLYEATEFRDEQNVRLEGTYWVQRNDLALSRKLEEKSVIVKPNRQMYDESQYDWEYNQKPVPMTSTLDPERFSGEVVIQKCTWANIYRIIEPYAKRRNLIVYGGNETDVSVPVQYAFTHENGQPVYVSGTGQYEKGLFTLDLSFYCMDGTTVGNCTEQFGKKTEWLSLGTGSITEDLLTIFFGVSNINWGVEIQEHMEIPGYYRLVNPYTSQYPYNSPGDYDDTKDYYLYIHAENPEEVWFERQDLGLDWGYGMMFTWSYIDYLINNGHTPDDVKAFYGKMENGVITFPAYSILLGMEGYKNGALYSSNKDGKFAVYFPEGYQRNSSQVKGKNADSSLARPKSEKGTALKPIPYPLSEADFRQTAKAKHMLREDAQQIESLTPIGH